MSTEDTIRDQLQRALNLLNNPNTGGTDAGRLRVQRAQAHMQLAQALMTAQSRGINL